MNRKHTVVNGASRMNECAEHIRALFAAEGYEAQSLMVNDPRQKGMLVQVRNAIGTSGVIKTITGLGACATLRLVIKEDSLDVEVLGGKWIDKAAVNLVSWVILWPLFVTSSIGMWRQKKLLDRMFMETMSFFTRQNVQLGDG